MGQELQNGSETHLEGGAADACAQRVGIMQMGQWWTSSHSPKHPRTLTCTNGLGRRTHAHQIG